MKSINTNLRVPCILMMLFILASCEKNEEDLQLKNQLIGTWKSTNSFYRSYTFNEDNTFIDSLFTSNSGVFITREIISGNYSIIDGQLNFSNIQLSYFQGHERETTISLTTQYDPLFSIQFNGDLLVLNQKDNFESVNKNNSGILGRWKHDKLLAVYDKNLDPKSTGGIVRGMYEFKSDLNVIWQYESIYENNVSIGNSTTQYDFNNSLININQWSLYNVSVFFQKNSMVWTYPDLIFERIR